MQEENIPMHIKRILCILILSIWSWSLLQFTFVLTATKARRGRITSDITPPKPKFVNGIHKAKEVCCSIDVWAILINIILQDAPFLVFRMLIIFYYEIVSYMNIFFTAKNTLVIILQFYRLYVVQQEKNKELTKMAKATTVSGNLAKAIERAAFIGPNTGASSKGGSGKSSMAKKAAAKKGTRNGGNVLKEDVIVLGEPSPQPDKKQKHSRSQDSITSQPTTSKSISAIKREMGKTGRRKSLSTGNLPEECEDVFTSGIIFEDELELGMEMSGGSVISGTNADSQEESADEDPPLDEISFVSEIIAVRPPAPAPTKPKNLRMSEQPGIYKISESSNASSGAGAGAGRRQDTGYSSSSKDSGLSQQKRGKVAANGASRTGRQSYHRQKHVTSNAVQRRRQMIIAKQLNSIEGGILDLGSSSSTNNDVLENERIFQRRAAICAVFTLFIVIFIMCMIAIYGGINPKGLVLRETQKVANTTRPPTTMATSITTSVVLSSSSSTPPDFPGEDDFSSHTSSSSSDSVSYSSEAQRKREDATEKLEISQNTPDPLSHVSQNDIVRHARHKIKRLYGYLSKYDDVN